MPGALFAPFRKRSRRKAIGVSPTAPAAPDTPSTPSPSDTATAYYTLLSWVSARATNFDVYLSTINPPTTIVAPQIQSASYIPTLLPGTTYYWKIAAFNAGGSATGPVWSFTTSAATATIFELAGSVLTSTDRARFPSLTIHDVLGAQPNTGAVTFGSAKTSGQAVRIGLGTLDDDALIFSGEIQSVDQDYEGLPGVNPLWHGTLIDHTFRLNKRRPFGTWVETSATTIARAIAVRYAPDFTTVGVQDGLPNVSIVFDGNDDFMTCMRRLATAISDFTVVGKTKVDYARDIKLFLIDPDAEQPAPINATHPPLDKPSPIEFSVDHSQIRTRVYGKGHAENVTMDVSVGETILPIADAIMFNEAGGQAVVATTSAGAHGTIITYESIELGGAGSLVGPGAAPSSPPLLALEPGSGLGTGTYSYAYTDVTAAGESLPSPLGTIDVGLTPEPTLAPVVDTPQTGGSIPSGANYDYAVTFVTATGETTLGPISGEFLAVSQISNPTAPTNLSGGPASSMVGYYSYSYTYINALGETEYSGRLATGLTNSFGFSFTIAVGPSGVTARRIYRTAGQASALVASTAPLLRVAEIDNVATTYSDALSDADLGAAEGNINTTGRNQVYLTSIPLGDATVTGRNLYRRVNGSGPFNLVAAFADNTTTTYTDGSASIGAVPPSSNTATANQTIIFYVPTGPTATTSRNIYRTLMNGSQLKFWGTLAGNVNTNAGFDNVPDASITGNANAPTSDTSGLTQPSGQVNAGSTSILTASAGPFQTSGGWVLLSGGQTVRYTGISGNTLTGVPATGSGAVITTVLYGSQVLPAPALVGINSWNGLSLAMATGSSVAIWVQRDDLYAQGALGQTELDADGNPTDGIREYLITDGRFGEDLLIATCDADLAQFSRPIVSCSYYTRDIKTKAGRTVSIDLSGFGEAGDFTIQSVDLSFDSPYTLPLRRVTASSTAFTLADLLRRVSLT